MWNILYDIIILKTSMSFYYDMWLYEYDCDMCIPSLSSTTILNSSTYKRHWEYILSNISIEWTLDEWQDELAASTNSLKWHENQPQHMWEINSGDKMI